MRNLIWFTLLYFNPSFHPDSIGSTDQARAYLATSPAIRAASH